MRASYLDILLVAIFVITLIVGYIKKFNKKNLLSDFQFGTRVIFAYFAAFITYDLIKTNDAVDKVISRLISNINGYIISPSFTAYILTVVIYAVSIIIIYGILNFLLFLFKKIYLKNRIQRIQVMKEEHGEKKAKIHGLIYSIPAAFAYCLIVFSIFMLLDVKGLLNINGEGSLVGNFVNSFDSTYVDTSVPFKPYVLNEKSGLIEANSIDGETDPNTIVYYNGVTLNQAIKSDAAINKMAKQLVAGDTTDVEKARALYNWIGSNITYNDAKAEEITQDDGKGVNSGAIQAFKTRDGVCFDYASLYVAMARAVGLEVRLVAGEGYTGTEWGPHAWNEVYIASEKKWIPVDTTFASTGDYFATSDFYSTHRDGKIIGQWN